MDYHGIIAFILILLTALSKNLAVNVIGPEDYCFLEVFQPKCKQNEVILIKKALYGRMKTGKCIKPNSEAMGCYANVQNIMDSMCSGKESCRVRVTHPDLTDTNPCNSVTLSYYLIVSYSCVQVQNPAAICSGNKPAKIRASTGFFSSGKTMCPVILNSESSNQMKLTLYNFLKSKDRSACYEIATIKDGTTQKTIHICENNERTKIIHTSSASKLEIRFTPSQQIEHLGQYLIEFEAAGCPHLPVPENGHAIREGDTATIVCNNSDTTWTTTCKDNKWTESDKKCPAAGWTFTEIVKTSREFPYGIFLTSIIGVGSGVLIGGFLLFLAINAFQRYQRRDQHYGPPPVIPDPDYKIYDTARMDLPFVPGYGHSTLPRDQMAAAEDAPPAPPPLSEATMKRLSRHTYERPKFPPPP